MAHATNTMQRSEVAHATNKSEARAVTRARAHVHAGARASVPQWGCVVVTLLLWL